MHRKESIEIIGCHAEGEVGDVIIGGVTPPPGDTIWQQSRWIAHDRRLRDFVLHEPRGGVFRHVNLLVPPKHPDADAAFIIMEPEDTPPMSGSNSICVATVVLETGIVTMQEPVTHITLEAPGGLVQVEAACKDGKVLSVKVHNHPSFTARLDAMIEVAGIGTLRVDTAYGGDSFVVVDAHTLGFSLSPDEARELATLGTRLSDAATEQLGFMHPTNPDWQHISFCLFTSPTAPTATGGKTRHAVAIRPGKIDRSPTGTGVSARLALLHARSVARQGYQLTAESIIGSTFTGAIEQETSLGQTPAIIPSIKGRAWTTGRRELWCDPSDPWPRGYRVSDTWPHSDFQDR